MQKNTTGKNNADNIKNKEIMLIIKLVCDD